MSKAGIKHLLTDCLDDGYLKKYAARHSDAPHLTQVATFLVSTYGGADALAQLLGRCLRQAYDEVIDMGRTGRWSINQLEKTEKTYVGTKVEILIRHALSLPKGKRLDLLVDGVEVDIKNTVLNNWSIPREAVGEVCMLVKGNDKKGLFSVGLLWAKQESLRVVGNRDGKVGVSSGVGIPTILWLAFDRALPENIFEQMSNSEREQVLDMSVGGTERLVRFFRLNQNKEISRDIILSIAQQKDAMKRARGNGGARDKLASEGLTLLYGRHGSAQLKSRGIQLAPTSFMCIRT